MTDLTAVDIMIQPDPVAIARARAVNARMPLSIPAGITLDDTHLPHITMLQRYLNTADLERAYAAITAVVANTDTAALSYHVPGIAYSEDWGPPGQAVAVLEVRPGPQVLDLQAALLAAVRPFTGSGGTDAAFVTDPGQQINPKTKDWVETFEPNQIGETAPRTSPSGSPPSPTSEPCRPNPSTNSTSNPLVWPFTNSGTTAPPAPGSKPGH